MPWQKSPRELWGDISSWGHIEHGGVILKCRGSTALPFTQGLKLTSNPKGTTTLNLNNSDSITNNTESALSSTEVSQMQVIFQVHRYNISSWNRSTHTITISSNFLDNYYPNNNAYVQIAQIEGLPNITGATNGSGGWLYGGTGTVNSGAFKLESSTTNGGASGTYGKVNQLYFDASNSNSIYGRQANVTPCNITFESWTRES